MGSFWAAALAQVRSWPRDRLFIWLLLMAPLSGMVILDGLFADGLLSRLPVAVCDLDGSSTSRELIRRVDALPSARVAALLASPDEGRDAIRRGEVFAVLVIPRHFERDLLRRRPVQAIAYIDGQHMPVGSVLRRDLVDLGTAGWKLAFTDTLRRSGVPPVQADWQTAGIGLDLRSLGNPAANYKIFLVHSFLPNPAATDLPAVQRLRPAPSASGTAFHGAGLGQCLSGGPACGDAGLPPDRPAGCARLLPRAGPHPDGLRDLSAVLAGLRGSGGLYRGPVRRDSSGPDDGLGAGIPGLCLCRDHLPAAGHAAFCPFLVGAAAVHPAAAAGRRRDPDGRCPGPALAHSWGPSACWPACTSGLGSLSHGLRSRRQEEEIAR